VLLPKQRANDDTHPNYLWSFCLLHLAASATVFLRFWVASCTFFSFEKEEK